MLPKREPVPVPVSEAAHPLRLTLVITALGGGGAERILAGLANRWTRGGHEVELLTLMTRDMDAYALDGGIRRVALDVGGASRHVLQGVARAVRTIASLREALQRSRPDVVVSFIGSTNLIVLLATAGMRVPVFVCDRTDPRFDPETLHRPSRALLRRVLYPHAAGVVVQTESVGAWMRTFCPRVHVIPNFVERPRCLADPGRADGQKRLVAAGRLVPAKGFDLLVSAFARASKAHPDWTLEILGEGPERAHLEAAVRAERLEDRVRLPGRVVDPFPHLGAAHAFALSSRREGFPNALLEAMAAGLPAVAFDCKSGPSEIIRDGDDGILVPAGDVGAFAAALERLMASPAERARLGTNARAIADVLAPERVLGLWNALLPASPRRI